MDKEKDSDVFLLLVDTRTLVTDYYPTGKRKYIKLSWNRICLDATPYRALSWCLGGLKQTKRQNHKDLNRDWLTNYNWKTLLCLRIGSLRRVVLDHPSILSHHTASPSSVSVHPSW